VTGREQVIQQARKPALNHQRRQSAKKAIPAAQTLAMSSSG